jgi:hypothetical protein
MEVTDLDRNSTTPVASRDADLTVRLATADEADGKSLRPLASLGGKDATLRTRHARRSRR